MIYEILTIFFLIIVSLVIIKKYKNILAEFQKIYKYNLLIIKSFKLDKENNIKLIYKKIFNSYFKIFLKTFVLLFPFITLYFFGGDKFLNYIFSIRVILVSLIVVFLIYFIFTSDRYDFLSIIIHKIFFNFDFFNIFLFDLEKKIYLPKLKDNYTNSNVFITGLPRSGTTAFLELLYSSKKFASFQYLDMPFILSPNFRKNFTLNFNKNFSKIERYHQDKIYINKNSPEAFDEVFFRIYDGKNYIIENNLKIYSPQEDILNNYKDLIHLCKISKEKDRYISKNNNNIIRIEKLSEYFNDDIFFILFRNPLDFAISSQKTNKKFSSLQTESNFIKNYIKFLGHYEFGIGSKHIYSVYKNKYQKNDINYWINYWLDVYKPYQCNNLNKNINLVCYENIKFNEKKLLDYLKLESFDYDFKVLKKEHDSKILDELNIDKKLLKEANLVYENLIKYSFL